MYPDGSTIDFQTQKEIPIAFHMTRVKLRNKRIVDLAELINEPWVSFHQIECDGILAITDRTIPESAVSGRLN